MDSAVSTVNHINNLITEIYEKLKTGETSEHDYARVIEECHSTITSIVAPKYERLLDEKIPIGKRNIDRQALLSCCSKILRKLRRYQEHSNCSDIISTDSSELYYKFRQSVATGGFTTGVQQYLWPTAELSTDSLHAIAQVKPEQEDMAYTHLSQEDNMAYLQKAIREYVRRMSDLTADVFDIIMAEWLNSADHPEAMVTISADRILSLRGVQKHKGADNRRGGYHKQLKDEIAHQMTVLSRTWIKVDDMIFPFNNRNKDETIVLGREYKAIVLSSRGSLTFLNSDVPEEYFWRVRPGDIFCMYLFGPGKQTALMSQKALSYDLKKQKYEKRLIRYLALEWRLRSSSSSSKHSFIVLTLLEEINLDIDSRNPIRTKERLEKALDTLHKDRVIDGWYYDQQCDENIIGKRGWIKKWKSWSVCIMPPKEIAEQYLLEGNNLKNSLPLLPEKSLASSFDINSIRNRRLAKNLTVEKAAADIGISKGILSRIERGEYTPSPQLLHKLQVWLTNTLKQ